MAIPAWKAFPGRPSLAQGGPRFRSAAAALRAPCEDRRRRPAKFVEADLQLLEVPSRAEHVDVQGASMRSLRRRRSCSRAPSPPGVTGLGNNRQRTRAASRPRASQSRSAGLGLVRPGRQLSPAAPDAHCCCCRAGAGRRAGLGASPGAAPFAEAFVFFFSAALLAGPPGRGVAPVPVGVAGATGRRFAQRRHGWQQPPAPRGEGLPVVWANAPWPGSLAPACQQGGRAAGGFR